MPDREKVIKGMKCCLHMLLDSGESHCHECPYNDLIMNHGCDNPVYCIKDYVLDALALLKEQEPVEPKVLIDTWICGNCATKLERQALIGESVLMAEQFNYCPCCGKAVKWDD